MGGLVVLLIAVGWHRPLRPVRLDQVQGGVHVQQGMGHIGMEGIRVTMFRHARLMVLTQEMETLLLTERGGREAKRSLEQLRQKLREMKEILDIW